MMEDRNFQEAVLMTYPERFSEEIITEKLIQVCCCKSNNNLCKKLNWKKYLCY